MLNDFEMQLQFGHKQYYNVIVLAIAAQLKLQLAHVASIRELQLRSLPNVLLWCRQNQALG
jgi:hypothetical protein